MTSAVAPSGMVGAGEGDVTSADSAPDTTLGVDDGSGAACFPYGWSGVSTGGVAVTVGDWCEPGEGVPVARAASKGVPGALDGVDSVAGAEESAVAAEDGATLPVASALSTVTLVEPGAVVEGVLTGLVPLLAPADSEDGAATGEPSVAVLALDPVPASGVSAAATAGAPAVSTAAPMPIDTARWRPAVIFFIARFVTELPLSSWRLPGN
ncbi:hypothetical protein ND991_05860 [Gordonia sputi]|uniref:hypothetical protein n=1 Tax=Gordonia sputi TaxID=36823 RepID=UPI0020446817|nr:hypothetical protein [Gordonia sputi]MCM3894744.1 hypothetical protein [Gordonia sputi]